MVEWRTQNLRRNGSISRGTSHATPKQRYQYTTSVDINNTRYKRIQSLIQNRMPMCAVSLLESREQRYIKAVNNNNNGNSKANGSCLTAPIHSNSDSSINGDLENTLFFFRLAPVLFTR